MTNARRFAEMVEHNHWHLGHAEASRRKQAAVAGNDHVVSADQHRIDETELGNRGGDLCDLLVGMCARIAGKRNEPIDRPRLNLEVHA